MQAHRVTYLAFLGLAVVLAGVIRLPKLTARPMHADEAVQAARFRNLWLLGDYRYDPHEFHGPTLPFSTLPAIWLSGVQDFAATDEATFRIVTALCGCAVVGLTWLLVDGLGVWPTWCAALFVAVSPGLVFYSRYYIHETLLVFFSLAAVGAAWRSLNSSRRLAWCIVSGASAGCLQATKETSVLVFAACAAATLGTAWATRRRAPRESAPAESPWPCIGLATLTAAVVTALLLSSFGTNLRGPLDGILTYAPWLKRATSTTLHHHPWYFYLHRLTLWRAADGPWWSEGLILGLGGLGFVVALFRPGRLPPGTHRGLVCWLGIYVLALITLYSAIPYKTPWCALGFLHGAALLAGVGAVTLVRVLPSRAWKTLVCVALLSGLLHLGWQAYRASYVIAADPRNPYVYAHTAPTIQRLVDDLDQLVAAAPSGYDVSLKLVWDSNYYWPLPWYLRRFSRVEYWNHIPPNPAAALVLASPRHDRALTGRLDATHLMTGYYAIRPNVLAQLWVRMDLWEQHLRRLGRI